MYQKITGLEVKKCGIALMGQHPAESWMSGSPDGIIKIDPQEATENALSEARQGILVPSSSNGLLEIKCPARRRYGVPENAQPYDTMPFYYVPQVQCLMEVLDLEWSHLYVWTARNGSRIFLVLRDKQYFLELYEYVADFWWNHVIPAKRCLANPDPNNGEDYMQYAPSALDPSHLIQESQRLAFKAQKQSFNSMGQLKR